MTPGEEFDLWFRNEQIRDLSPELAQSGESFIELIKFLSLDREMLEFLRAEDRREVQDNSAG